MPAKGYSTVALPNFLLDKVDRIVEQKEKYCYVSKPEFIKEAIREKIERITKM